MVEFPVEAYHETARSRALPKIEDAPEYGLGGAAYAKARDLRQKADWAVAWQDENNALRWTWTLWLPR